MDRSKLKGYVVFLAIVLAVLIPTAIAVQWIYSNTVTVTVQEYSMNLEPTTQFVTRYQNASFTATLTKDGTPISGATVILYKEGVQVSTNVTDVNGVCTFRVNMTDPAGDYSFKAGYQIP